MAEPAILRCFDNVVHHYESAAGVSGDYVNNTCEFTQFFFRGLKGGITFRRRYAYSCS